MPSPKRRLPKIWATDQLQPRRQRGPAYVAGGAHPAKMWPAIARTAIARYSHPGETVLDPMCGIGTSLVEAVLADRSALGVDLEAQWADYARANLAAALQAGPGIAGRVLVGDAADLPRLLADHGVVDPVDLILISPPYGAVAHGQPDTARVTGGAIRNRAHRYHDRQRTESLATSSLPRLSNGLERVFTGCFTALRPGGFMVVTARPFTEQGRLVDFPSLVIRAGLSAGLVLHERCVALLSRWDGQVLRPYATFFHLSNTRAMRSRGKPALLRAHEDVLVFRRPA